jgi:hypothetical protein
MALEEGRTSEAIDAFAEAFGRSQSGPWSLIVAQTLARAGVVDELADRLLATPGAGAGALVHLQSHLFAAGRYPEAAGVGQRAFDAGAEEPAHVAYDVACSWARATRPDEALDWLERAVGAGLADRSLVDDDPDLATIRGTARYQAVTARMAPRTP